MSAPIRPLPVEAAPQRTESAAKNSKPDEGPGFGEVLDLHLDEKVEETKDEPKQEPEKKANDTDSSAWAVLGILMAPPAVVQTPQVVERGNSCPQEERTTDSSREANAALGLVDQAPSDELADKNVRVPSQDATAKADIASLVQKLTPAPDEQKLPTAHEAKPEELAGKPEESGENIRGTPDAKQAVVLLNVERNNTSGSLEQPAGFQVPQVEAVSEQAAVVSRPLVRAAEHPIEFPADKVILNLDSFAPSIRVESPNALPDTHRVTEVRAAAVVDAIREHVQVLRAAQANELNVVLRPDANTELVLQLRHVDGQVLLQARCERGDFTWLDSQWNGIQNTLAQQGVRVEPLQAAYRSQDGGANSMFLPDQRGSRQRDERNLSFEQESSRTSKNSSRPVKSAARLRGWQSWA